MPQDIYAIASLACRYWFAFLGVLIVWRSFVWLRKDRRQINRRLKTLPDAGMIGELVVLQGSDELPEDTYLPVPREGTLGCLRTCDLVVPVAGVARQHLDFVFVNGQGLRLNPHPGCVCIVDGEPVTDRLSGEQFPMGHNSLLSVGDAMLKLRLFAGLDAPYPAEFLPDDYADSWEPPPDEAAPAYLPQYEQQQSFYPPQEQPYAQQPPWQQMPPPIDEQQYPDAYQQPQTIQPSSRNRRYNDET